MSFSLAKANELLRHKNIKSQMIEFAFYKYFDFLKLSGRVVGIKKGLIFCLHLEITSFWSTGRTHLNSA